MNHHQCHNCTLKNRKLFSCEECQSSFCYKCIQELISARIHSLRNLNKKEILLCYSCIPKEKYNTYTNKYSQETLDNIENGNLIQCDYCLRVWDGCAQCDCPEYYDYMDQIKNERNTNNLYKLNNFLPFIQQTFDHFIAPNSNKKNTSSTYLPTQTPENHKLNAKNTAFYNSQQYV
jgi:hypothetical protein